MEAERAPDVSDEWTLHGCRLEPPRRRPRVEPLILSGDAGCRGTLTPVFQRFNPDAFLYPTCTWLMQAFRWASSFLPCGRPASFCLVTVPALGSPLHLGKVGGGGTWFGNRRDLAVTNIFAQVQVSLERLYS